MIKNARTPERYETLKASLEYGSKATGTPVTVLLHRMLTAYGFEYAGCEDNMHIFEHPDHLNEDGSKAKMEDWAALAVLLDTNQELQAQIDSILDARPEGVTLH